MDEMKVQVMEDKVKRRKRVDPKSGKEMRG